MLIIFIHNLQKGKNEKWKGGTVDQQDESHTRLHDLPAGMQAARLSCFFSTFVNCDVE